MTYDKPLARTAPYLTGKGGRHSFVGMTVQATTDDTKKPTDGSRRTKYDPLGR